LSFIGKWKTGALSSAVSSILRRKTPSIGAGLLAYWQNRTRNILPQDRPQGPSKQFSRPSLVRFPVIGRAQETAVRMAFAGTCWLE
jgi:hypothetical protein